MMKQLYYNKLYYNKYNYLSEFTLFISNIAGNDDITFRSVPQRIINTLKLWYKTTISSIIIIRETLA